VTLAERGLEVSLEHCLIFAFCRSFVVYVFFLLCLALFLLLILVHPSTYVLLPY
jgi:hypothetical protein